MEVVEVNIIASEFPCFFSNSSQLFQDSDLIMSIMRRKNHIFWKDLHKKMQFFKQILLCYVVTIFSGGKKSV